MELLVIYLKACLTVGVVKRRPKSAFTGKNLCFARYVNKAQEDHAAEESHFYRAAERHILQMDVAGLTSKRLVLSGDIHSNPGPTKFPCKECGKSVRKNQNAVLCSECGFWIHATCLNMSNSAFKYLLDRPTIDWICPICSLPPLSDSFLWML